MKISNKPIVIDSRPKIQEETIDCAMLRASFIASESVYQRWPELELRIEHRKATITFNRPKASNCLNLSAINALKEALSICEASAHVKAICLTGTDSAFC